MVKNEKIECLGKAKQSLRTTIDLYNYNTMGHVEEDKNSSTCSNDFSESLLGGDTVTESCENQSNMDHVTNQATKNFLARSLGHMKQFSWWRVSTGDTFTDSTDSDGIHDAQDESGYNEIEDSDLSERDGHGDNDRVVVQDDHLNVPFVDFFVNSKGPPQIALLSMLYALALGSTVGVVPAVLTEKYAVLYHSFDGECSEFDRNNKPQACLDGSSDAQTAAATASFVSNVGTFLTSSLIGSITDEYGRRNMMVLSQFLSCLAPTILVLLQIFNNMDPGWYYTASAINGFISWISIALSSLSDVMPKQWRAPMFGLLLSGFSLGFALSPIFAIFFSHFGVSLLSLAILLLSLVYSVFYLPETLPANQAIEARSQRSEYRMRENESKLYCISRSLLRPFKELMILNRNNLFRLLSLLAFFSGMSTSADQTLLIYYVEDRLGFKDQDIAILFGLIGFVGIFVQGVMLKFFTDLVGERFVIVIAFISGAITNTMYSFAKSRELIFLAVIVGSFNGMSFPTISAIKSNNAEETEQGRIQGALYALSSLASAVGPAVLRLTYQKTRDTKYPGAFFLVASGFYVVAVVCSCALPEDKANARRRRNNNEYDEVARHESINSLTES